MRAFIKGGGLKRLLEAVTPRSAHAVHADTGPTAKCPRFPIDCTKPVFTQAAKFLSAAVYNPASKRRLGRGPASGFTSLLAAQRQCAEQQECSLRATPPPLLRGIDALVFCAQQTIAAFPSRGSAQFAEDKFKRLRGGKDSGK